MQAGSTKKLPVRIVLFDLGRVVLDWSPERLYQQLIPDAAERKFFLSEICSMDWHMEHDRGISFAENALPLIAEYPDHEALIRAWSARWMDMFDGYVDGTPELMDRLYDKGVPLFALTNMPSETWPMMQMAFPRMGLFEDVIVSGDEACAKPDAQIFQIAIDRMDQPDPAEVLFIDDSAQNITAADGLGFQTHHFNSAKRLETDLIALNLLP
ncbi:MAG: HAD family phosphatase [Pseudomonadota bacterium]